MGNLWKCPNCGAILQKGSQDVFDVVGTDGLVGTATCGNCGAQFSQSDVYRGIYDVDGEARISEPSMEKAGAGVRLVSFILDGIVLVVIFVVISIFVVIGVESTVGSFIWLLISMGYFTYFFGNGQTLGMKAMKIKLCGADGTYPIGYGKGFLRWIGLIISTWVIYLGFLWILIDENKQGWHDKIASTYVVLE